MIVLKCKLINQSCINENKYKTIRDLTNNKTTIKKKTEYIKEKNNFENFKN